MTFGNALVSFFKNIFNFSGRARRKEYFSVMLLVVIIIIALSFLFGDDREDIINLAIIRGLIALLIVPLCFRRLHDIGLNGGFSLLPCLSYLAFIGGIRIGLVVTFPVNLVAGLFFLYLSLVDSDPNTNFYGPSPKPVDGEELILDRRLKNRKHIDLLFTIIFILSVVFSGIYFAIYRLSELLSLSEKYPLGEGVVSYFVKSYYPLYVCIIALILIVLDYSKKKILSAIAMIAIIAMGVQNCYYTYKTYVDAAREFYNFYNSEYNSLLIMNFIQSFVSIVIIIALLGVIFIKKDIYRKYLFLFSGLLLICERIVFWNFGLNQFYDIRDVVNLTLLEFVQSTVWLNAVYGAILILIVYNKRMLQKLKEEKASLPVNAVQE